MAIGFLGDSRDDVGMLCRGSVSTYASRRARHPRQVEKLRQRAQRAFFKLGYPSAQRIPAFEHDAATSRGREAVLSGSQWMST